MLVQSKKFSSTFSRDFHDFVYIFMPFSFAVPHKVMRFSYIKFNVSCNFQVLVCGGCSSFFLRVFFHAVVGCVVSFLNWLIIM